MPSKLIDWLIDLLIDLVVMVQCKMEEWNLEEIDSCTSNSHVAYKFIL